MGLEQFDTIIAFSAVMLTLSLLVTIVVQMVLAVLNMRGLVAPGAFTSCVPIGSKAPSSKPTSSTSSTT